MYPGQQHHKHEQRGLLSAAGTAGEVCLLQCPDAIL